MYFPVLRPIYRQILLFFLVVWMISFPIKGVSYQLSLYLLPVLVVTFPETRPTLFGMKKELLVLTLCLALPTFLSELRAFVVFGGSLSKDPFHAFWRLSLLPLVLVTVCCYCNLSASVLRKWCVFFFSIYALVACIFFWGDVGQSSGWRESGFVHNPNPFGVLMVSGALLALISLLQSSQKREACWYSLALVLMCVGAVLSGSRSAWLGGFVAFILIILLSRDRFFWLFSFQRRKAMLAFGIIILFISLFFFMDTNFEQYLSQRVGDAFNGDIRLQIWQGYLSIADQYPFLGRPMSPERKVVVNGYVYGPHNMYLSTFLEAGLLGLIGLFFTLIWLVFRGFHLKRSERIAPIALLLLLCIYCFFNSSVFGHVMTQGLFALIVAFILIPVSKRNYS